MDRSVTTIDFEALRERFGGTHSAVAAQLGITPRQYFNLRSGKPVSRSLVAHLFLLVDALSGQSAQST
jgi:hypothetical protein